MGTITILGSGGWGTAMACHLSGKARVQLWCAHPATADRLTATRVNASQLPGVRIPDDVDITADESAIAKTDHLLILAVPTVHLEVVLKRLASHVPERVPVVSLTKGIAFPSFERPSQLLKRLWSPREIAVFSGPNHAEEISRGLPASAVVASANEAFAEECRELFGSDRFRVYSHTDVVGVEIAGAYKNVLGIAAGICDGLRLGDNAKAALLTRGLVEMTRFGVSQGADAQTFSGLAGVGDLIATCFSQHGRNRRLGERIANGETLQQITSGPQVAEGANTAKSLCDFAKKNKIELPIAMAVNQVLYEGRSPGDAMKQLMSRTQKDERRSV